MTSRRRPFIALIAALALLFGLAACSGGDSDKTVKSTDVSASGGPSVRSTKSLEPAVVLDSNDPATLALKASQTFFATAPVVVVAEADDTAAQATGAAAANEVHGPLLLVGGTVTKSALRTELHRVKAKTLVSVSDGYASEPETEETNGPGRPNNVLLTAQGVRNVHLETDSLESGSSTLDPRGVDTLRDAGIDDSSVPAKNLSEVLVLTDGTPAQVAAVATARAAGAWPTTVASGDPRSTAQTVQLVSNAKALAVVGIGTAFGSAESLAWKVKAAETGVQLPGGGQLALPGKTYAAYPIDASDLEADNQTSSGTISDPTAAPTTSDPYQQMIDSAKDVAAAFSAAMKGTFVPTIEVPASRLTSSPGEDGSYSELTDPDEIAPLIDAAAQEGVYVTLRFSPGAQTFAEQITADKALLDKPNVGVALNLDDRLVPYVDGHRVVDTNEVNTAIGTVAAITRSANLPQKLLVVQTSDPANLSNPTGLQAGAGEIALVMESTATGTAQAREQAAANMRATVSLPWGMRTADEDSTADVDQVSNISPAPVYISGSVASGTSASGASSASSSHGTPSATSTSR